MKNFFYISLAVIAAMASCSKENGETPDTWSGELRITSGIETRASGQTWEAADEIGVFMSETGTTTAVGTHNTKYATTSTTTSAEFTVDSEFDDLYYPQSGNVDIVAHYPYHGSATVSTYPINVTDQTDLTAIDFMSAKMENIEKSKTALALSFHHLLSQLNVILTPATDGGLTAAELATAKVTISGTMVSADATVDYDTTESKPTATFATSGTATDLSLTAASSKATFIVIPQTADLTFTISVANVGEFEVKAAATTFTSGDEHNYTISVSKTAAKISGATIAPWGTGTSGSLDADDFIVKDTDPIVFADANFKAALLSDKNINTTDDDEITYGEAKAFSGSLRLYNKGISTMNEISFFPNITELYCSENSLTFLDLSKNTALEYIVCDTNSLTSIDLSNCTALEEIGLSKNSLTSLDLSDNTALTNLICNDNQLTSLDLSKNTKLDFLCCNNNSLTSLNISNNTELTSLQYYNNSLTSIDLSNNTKLEELHCSKNSLTSLDISKNTALTYLTCEENQLTSLDLSNNTELTNVDCQNNSFTSLDLSKNTKLSSLICHGNPLTSLDLSKNTAMRNLYCYDTPISSLILTDLKSLYTLQCYNCRLSTLDISSCDIVGNDGGDDYSQYWLRIGNQTSDGTTTQELTLTISATQSTNGLNDTFMQSSASYNSNVTLLVNP